MWIGTRSVFSVKDVLAAVTASYAASKMQVEVESELGARAVQSATSTATSAAISVGIYHQAPDPQSLLAQTLGSQVGETAGNKLCEQMELAQAQSQARSLGRETARSVTTTASRLSSVPTSSLRGRSGSSTRSVYTFSTDINATDPRWSDEL